MIEYNIVGTGSSGNCVILSGSVMVDIGVSYAKIAQYVNDIKLVLLTHVHGDHYKASTARRLALEKPKIRFACAPWMAKPLLDAGVSKHQILIMQPKLVYGYGICNVISFEVEHDVPNVGYKIHFPGCRVFYATDMGNLNNVSARDYDLYLIESNYRDDEIRARMDEKKANGQYAYEQRVIKYHMSEKQSIDWLIKNMGANSEYAYLHCHKEAE